MDWPGTPEKSSAWPGTPDPAPAQAWPGKPVEATAWPGTPVEHTGTAPDPNRKYTRMEALGGLAKQVGHNIYNVAESIVTLPQRAGEAGIRERTGDPLSANEMGGLATEMGGMGLRMSKLPLSGRTSGFDAKAVAPAVEAPRPADVTPPPKWPGTPEPVAPASGARDLGAAASGIAEERPPVSKPEVQAVADDLHRLRQSSVADRAEIGNKLEATPQIETIKSPAVKVGDKIVEDLNHGIATDRLETDLGRTLKLNEIESGFTTSTGRFVDREEAARIANAKEDLQSGDIPIAERRAALAGVTKSTQPVGALQAARNAAGTIEKIVSPDTVNAEAKQAAAAIRSAGGTAARDTATTEHLLEPAWKKVNAMPDADRLDFISYVENRTGAHAGLMHRDPELQALANTMRYEFEKRMTKIQNLPSHDQATFIEDYFPHFWKDPGAATKVAQTHGGAPARQGSGASMKKRTVPTIADGIAAGLEPVTTSPLEATLRYVQSMDRFIASTEVFETAVANGTIKFVKPKVMGASGHPDSFRVPDGYTKLEGRGAQRADGSQAYAPEGWARVYNNFISKGAHAKEEYGKAYDTARRATNSITAMELGLSGYHALTMAQESMVNSVANAVGYARKGMPGQAAKSLGKATVAPVGYAMKGKKLQDVYLGTTPGTQEMREMVDLLTEAGGRAKGAKHAPDYEFSKGGSYVTALKRGALRLQLAADKADVKAAPMLGSAKVAARHLGRIMDTVAQPIFEKYIPLIKNGAFYENMSAWLKTHPNATAAEKSNAARQIVDSIDNRFGEMVQDNVFWNKALKQAAMLSLRSWSWSVGGVGREMGGAVRDVARAPFKTKGGRNPAPGQGRGPNDERWTQKMDYAIALPVTYAALSAIYQGLKTGEAPESVQDLLAPRTGGVDAATGEPERLMVPGYMKDVFGFYAHPVQEATNKIATAPQVVGQLATNKNWRGDPILSPSSEEGLAEDAPRWLQEFWKYTTETLGPITVRDMMKGKKEGSNLNAVEKGLGVRNAPRYLTDPEGYEKMMKSIHGRDWQKKMRYEKRQQNLYE